MLYKEELITELIKEGEVVIYGAGVMGKALKVCLKDAPYNLSVTSFLVRSMEGNPDEIEGIPVLDLEHAAGYKEKKILVALHEKHIKEAMKELRDKGFSRLIPISFDSDIWSNIRGNWLYNNQAENGLTYIDLNEALENELHVYVVHSIADRTLKEESKLRSFEIPIQVGAALTDIEMFPVRDCVGENISDKNPQYCELTALYWIWKHDKSKYVGLSHYRRKFDISEEQARKLLNSDIDIVATVPVLNMAGIRQQYCSDHEEKDWDIMLEAIKSIHPEYMSTADKVQNGIYYYAYNMFITRKEILDDYCKWLFPILSYCEEKIGIKTDSYQNRYIGFLAERLLTIYFTHNRQYKLAIACKHFMESI
ncbi:DUF4422 domain-containing protein [Parablautia muri]|nr:DUF4422 domain-containing protein [Parablautia muri]